VTVGTHRIYVTTANGSFLVSEVVRPEFVVEMINTLYGKQESGKEHEYERKEATQD
jgi:hypothetical protein